MINLETFDNLLPQNLPPSQAASYHVRAWQGRNAIAHAHLEISRDAHQVDHVCHQHVQRYSVEIVFSLDQDRLPSQHGAFLG